VVSLPQARAIGIGLLSAIALLAGQTVAAPLRIVAAENVYGDIAAQIGGDAVSVVSVLNNPAQDPHLFEASASVARAVADADLVIYNGANYDPWMAKLLAASKSDKRKVIVVSDLNTLSLGDNPHLWYEWGMVLAAADVIATELAQADVAGAAGYQTRTKDFHDAVLPVIQQAAAMQKKFEGTPITATEPVFDLMARHIRLDVRNAAFQRAVMNGTEPSARDVAAFEDDLKNHRVKALLFNTQSGGELSQRMKAIAEAAKIPVVGISETEPPGVHYQDWMLAQLNALDAALSGTAK
jgi:zinc/manganese transport system substrate-binding protein